MAVTSLASTLAGLAAAPNLLPVPSYKPWVAVRPRFTQFNANLSLTLSQTLDGYCKYTGVVDCLNRHYYNVASDTDHSLFVGSWGKQTAIRPPRDVDVYFVLPEAVYYRFQSRAGNIQSALLQEVKGVLANTYSRTEMSGDGQIVLVEFESYNVEVVPVFHLTNGRFWICDTKNGGRFKETDPFAEIAYINAVDEATNTNLRPLIRMLKAWQNWCNVPIKSFQMELVAAQFLAQCPWRIYDYFFFDWILRDFFAYLYGLANTFVVVPGTCEWVFLGDDWQSRTLTAYQRACRACGSERDNQVAAAGDEWQKIFGFQIPRCP